MHSLTQVAEALQSVLTTVADQLARASGFVQRQSKLTGAKFAQTLVFTWLNDPAATYEQLAQTATALGVPITAQGLDDRFTPAAAQFLKALLAAAMQQVIRASPAAIPLLQRFQGVYVQDSTTIALPPALASVWAGCGNGACPQNAALKVQLQVNLNDGQLTHLDLQPGRASDRSAPMQTAALPPGSLRLADLGYYSLPTWAEYAYRDEFWLSRLPPQCALYREDGTALDLPAVLATVGEDPVDLAVRLSQKHQLPCRLIAARVPLAVAAERRRKARADAKRKGYTPSARLLALCAWALFVTNVPPDKLNAHAVLVIARLRWQIELIFKLWKTHGQVDTSRSAKPSRILCEVYAKLLGLLLQHWIMIVGSWVYANRSWFKAAKTIRQHSSALAIALTDTPHLLRVLEIIGGCLAKGARLNTRKTTPNTVQLVLACAELA
jgi:hypothetical protein